VVAYLRQLLHWNLASLVVVDLALGLLAILGLVGNSLPGVVKNWTGQFLHPTVSIRRALVPVIIVSVALLLSGMTIHPAEAASSTVNIQNFAFTPQNVTIRTNDAVTWTNNDPVIYTLWFTNASDGSTYLISQPINPGTSWTHTFPDKIKLNYSDFDRLYVTGQLTVLPTGTVGGVVVPVDKIVLLSPFIMIATLTGGALSVAVYAFRDKIGCREETYGESDSMNDLS
jgi:plastocyanin